MCAHSLPVMPVALYAAWSLVSGNGVEQDDCCHAQVALFKPADEEPFGANNPRHMGCSPDGHGLRKVSIALCTACPPQTGVCCIRWAVCNCSADAAWHCRASGQARALSGRSPLMFWITVTLPACRRQRWSPASQTCCPAAWAALCMAPKSAACSSLCLRRQTARSRVPQRFLSTRSTRLPRYVVSATSLHGAMPRPDICLLHVAIFSLPKFRCVCNEPRNCHSISTSQSEVRYMCSL